METAKKFPDGDDDNKEKLITSICQFCKAHFQKVAGRFFCVKVLNSESSLYYNLCKACIRNLELDK